MKTIEQQLYDAFYNCTDPRMDGYSQFNSKQKLYEAKWLADKLLYKCPTFVGEEEYLEELRRKYESK